MKIAGVWLFDPFNNPHVKGLKHLAQTLAFTLRDLGHGDGGVYHSPGKNVPREGGPWLVVGAHQDPTFLLENDPSRWVIYNTEQGETGHFSPAYEKLLHISLCWWDYSDENVKLYDHRGLVAGVIRPFGHPLARVEADFIRSPPIDILFAGSFHPRRTEVLDDMRKRGFVVVHAFNVYGAKLSELIHDSKICLNMHYYDAGIFEAVRVQQLVAHGAAVLSERSRGKESDAFPVHVARSREELAETAEWILRDHTWINMRVKSIDFTRTMHEDLAAAIAGL